MKKIITYSNLKHEAIQYLKWFQQNPVTSIPHNVALEGAGSEWRTPLMHFGTVSPVYLSIQRYIKKIGVKKGMKLIELGCGTGRFLSYLGTVFPELKIYGVDYSSSVIDYANKKYANNRLIFKKTDTTKDKLFSSGSFDFVISSHVIEHIKQKDGIFFLKECSRLLRKNGYIFVGTPERRHSQNLYINNPDEDPKKRLTPPHEHEYIQRELENLAKKIFRKENLQIDFLINPIYFKIFSTSVKKLSPRYGNMNKIRNFIYTTIRDYTPKIFFDY
ncbi:MAG: methyltransferase domain-containing protein, partial [Patescibacteria group bacterium]